AGETHAEVGKEDTAGDMTTAGGFASAVGTHRVTSQGQNTLEGATCRHGEAAGSPALWPRIPFSRCFFVANRKNLSLTTQRPSGIRVAQLETFTTNCPKRMSG